jgi:hypothetical protein
MFNHSWVKMITQYNKHEIRVTVTDPDGCRLAEQINIDMFFVDTTTDQEIEELVQEYLTNLYNSLPDLTIVEEEGEE